MSVETNELDWLAYCFVAEELSADEATRFELRLANDQAAREAVARAVQLREAVAALPTSMWQDEPLVAPVLKSPRWQPARWAALFAAACVVGFLAVALVNQNNDRVNEKAGAGLAEAWTNYRTTDVERGEDTAVARSVSDFSSAIEADIFGDEQLVEELQSPDWLLAAVTVPMTMPTDDGEPSAEQHE